MASVPQAYNIADLRRMALKRVPKGLFEFVDRGSEDEIALEDNRAAFRRLKLRTRFLVDLTDRDLGTDLFGKRSELPLAIAPTGIAGLLCYQGELALPGKRVWPQRPGPKVAKRSAPARRPCRNRVCLLRRPREKKGVRPAGLRPGRKTRSLMGCSSRWAWYCS